MAHVLLVDTRGWLRRAHNWFHCCFMCSGLFTYFLLLLLYTCQLHVDPMFWNSSHATYTFILCIFNFIAFILILLFLCCCIFIVGCLDFNAPRGFRSLGMFTGVAFHVMELRCSKFITI